MNERIKELADKIWEEKYWTNPNTDKLLPAQLNRFAELIVNECMEVASPKLTDVGEWDAGMRLVQKRLKKHFRVD